MKYLFALTLLTATAFAHAENCDGAKAASVPSKSKLTIEEYVDFACPYCASGNATMQKVVTNYHGKVTVVSHPIALPSHGEPALFAAKAYNAIYMQDPSLANAFQQEMFTHQNDFEKDGDASVYKAAKTVGADVDRLKIDVKSAAAAKMLADNQASFENHGFNGTPSFMIGKEPIVGAEAYEEIKDVVDRQLKE